VDAELLRELGERLVGQPHIALAELIKNAYDADATKVIVDFSHDQISVTDNGHGMSEAAFAQRWMRIGTTRKRAAAESPTLHRALTGSKGVGRLAAQLLARELTLESKAVPGVGTTTDEGSARTPGISADVDWDAAVTAGDLTSVKVAVRALQPKSVFADGSSTGTRVVLRQLTEDWDEVRFRGLAQEIWALRAPFETDDESNFDVVLVSKYDDVAEAFAKQMDAIFTIWNGRIVARLLPENEEPVTTPVGSLPLRLPYVFGEAEDEEIGDDSTGDAYLDVEESTQAEQARKELPTRFLEATVTLRDTSERTVVWRVDQCDIDELDFEIRVFELNRRQPHGIRVMTARDYLRRFGGVGIYDGSFRLPYYGVEQDWLKVDRDQARRLNASALLPDNLVEARGMQSLPANRQLFGRISVSTNHEAKAWSRRRVQALPPLSVQVTRDRLVDNAAYNRLQVLVRATLDLYAMEKTRRRIALPPPSNKEAPRPVALLREAIETFDDARTSVPEPVFETVRAALVLASTEVKRSETSNQAYAAVLGSLATAGMTSLAYEHELSKQVNAIQDMSEILDRLIPDVNDRVGTTLARTIKDMRDWRRRVTDIRQVFQPLLADETRSRVNRYRARPTIEAVIEQVAGLVHGVPIDTSGVPSSLKLPEATYPAWSSIFQNVIINAYNAVREREHPTIAFDGAETLNGGWLRICDNGVGVDLEEASELWKPFERRLVLPPDLESAGMGGMGMGLTIVRMIGDATGVSLRFEQPPEGMSTALRMTWRAKNS
jgi:signal transduction histidine kinase